MASIRKRHWPSNEKTKSGWVVDYRDNGGRRRLKSFRLKKEADRFLALLLPELADGSHIPASETTTVREACNLRLQRAVREGLEQSTYDEYEQISRLHIIPLIGNVKLNLLTKARVERFRDDLLATRSYDRSRRTILHLKMVLQEAQRLGKVNKNAASGVELKARTRHESDVIILSPTEFNDFLDAAESLGKREHAFAQLLMHGFRISEIRGMPWECFNATAGTISVKQRADKACKIGSPKTKKSRRTLPLMPEAIDALSEWRKESGGEGLVFSKKNGKPLYYRDVILQLFDPIMFRAGLTRVSDDGSIVHRYSLHPFRHTTASLWIEYGFSPKRVSAWLGHSSIQVTFDRYGHLFDLKYSSEEMMRQLEMSIRRRAPWGDASSEMVLPGILDSLGPHACSAA